MFYDTYVEKGLGKECRYFVHCASRGTLLGGTQFEPLIVAIVFPLSHVSDHTGLWAIKGMTMGLYLERALKEGFKQMPQGLRARGRQVPGGAASSTAFPPPLWGGRVPGNTGKLHVLDGPMPGVFDNPEAGSWSLLQELHASAGKLPPVHECLVQHLLPVIAKQQLPQVEPPAKQFRPGG
jgi:hypothetical protein